MVEEGSKHRVTGRLLFLLRTGLDTYIAGTQYMLMEQIRVVRTIKRMTIYVPGTLLSTLHMLFPLINQTEFEPKSNLALPNSIISSKFIVK